MYRFDYVAADGNAQHYGLVLKTVSYRLNKTYI